MSTSAATYSTRLRSNAEQRASLEAAAYRNLREAVDEGWRYFWARRSIQPPHPGSVGGHSFNPDTRKPKDIA